MNTRSVSSSRDRRPAGFSVPGAGAARRFGGLIVSVASVAGLIAVAATPATHTAGAVASPTISGVVADRPVDNAVQFTDGEVRAVTEVGTRVVAGGTFTGVGPAIRGAAGTVDLATGNFTAGFPDVVGSVLTAVADGGGGYWIGGNFALVGGQPRTHVAHVLSDMTVDPTFAPTLDAPVRSIAISGVNVVVAGAFTTVNGAPAVGLAAIGINGTMAWGGGPNGPLYVVLSSLDGSRLFVGGDFTAMTGNTTYKRLAAVNASTGALDTTFNPGVVTLPVRDLALQGSNLWFAGEFTKVNNISRTRLAAVDSTTGALNPVVPTAPNGTVRSIAVSSDGATLYVGGDFTRLGTTNINGFAGISTASGALTTTPLTMTGTVYDITLDGAGSAYLGGNFVITPEKSSPRTLAKLNLASLTAASIVPPAALPLSLARPALDVASVRTVALVGNTLLVGGDFSDYGTIARPYLVAWDKTSGALDLAFSPQLNAAVRALDGSVDGNSVFVGGDFTTINGAQANRIAKLSVVDGSRDPAFTVSLDAYVKEVVVHTDGNRLFVGGNFRFTNSTNTERFVGLNAATGAILPGYQIDLTNPTNLASEGGVRAMSLNPDGTRLVIIGNFFTVEGLPRPLVTVLDVSDANTASVTGWTTSLYTQPCAGGRVGWMRDVSYSPDGARFYIGSSGHFYYRACDSLNAFDATATGTTEPLWTARPGDTIETVAATTDAVYLGGHFRFLDWEHQTDGRFQLGAVNPTDGRPLSWNPSANGFRGILTLEAEPSGLLLGGDNTSVGGISHGRTARFVWPTGPWTRRTVDHHIVLAGGDNITVNVAVTNPGPNPLDLTTFTDSLSGAVTGQGTCVPTTVAAGATFNCSYPQVVPPFADTTLTTVTTTIDATNGTAIRLADRTTIRSQTAYRGVDVRSVVGPLTAPFPSGSVKWSVTMWNDNELVPMQLTALTSTLHGNLNGQGSCVIPQTIAPYSMYQCMYDGVVSGQIGETVSNQFKMDYVLNGVPGIDRHSTAITMARPANGGEVLLVVGNATAVSDADVKIRDRFAQLGFLPVYIDDDVATAADATGRLLVYLSTTVDQVKVANKFAAVPVPVMTALQTLYDEMGLTLATDVGTVTTTSINVAAPLHPLVSPQLGAVTVFSSARPATWGVPTAAAKVVSTVTTPGGEKPSEFVYRPGDQLADGSTAIACRMGYSAEKTSIAKWATQMYAWFDRAVRWSVYGCGNGIISTVAGNGGSTSTGNGGSATGAGLNDPFGVAADALGGFYVAELGGNRVRYVNTTGTINAFAGTGTAGSAGDNGPAAGAQLRGPARVRLDPNGLVVIVDTGNNKIRRVDAAGVITTIAGTGSAGFSGDGGPATAAKLSSPYDVAWDPAGTMYIADRSNHRIRKVASNGVISTVAGTGTGGYNGDGITATTARLFNPYGIAFGPDGLLIADFDNNRVRLVNGAGIIQTVAGSGLATAGGDGGPATLADLHKPVCIVVRATGGFYICDMNNNRVRYVNGDGVISTTVGVGTAGFGGDGDLATFALGNRFTSAAAMANGDLVVVDRFNRRVRVVVKAA